MKTYQYLSLVALAASLTQLHAVTYDANINGTTAPAGSTFTPAGGSLGLKTVAGWVGLGVTDGASGNEIDLNQSLTVGFGGPQIVGTLTLGFLFDGPEFGDNDEIAKVQINGTTTYTLQAVGLTSNTWDGGGSVSNLSPADGDHAAVWAISNPFGNTPVNSITLFPASSNPNGNESDFSLVAFSTRSVPDGGSMFTLLGVSLTTLSLLRRKLS